MFRNKSYQPFMTSANTKKQVKFLAYFYQKFFLLIYETTLECGIKKKVDVDLLHRNVISESYLCHTHYFSSIWES